MKGKKRHDIAYRFFSTLIYGPVSRKFNFECDSIKIDKAPYIVVSNHLTNWDPILIGLSFLRNMYYVATDQIFRMGWKSKLLTYLFSPIARAKAAQETQTVITIFRRLKDKCNICIFAEGATSFDGETGEVLPSIGKLVKRAGVTLVTYRFTGSYFTFPRWARFVRKGKMEGRLVQTYSPEEINSMSEDEIYQTIIKDIYVNAYDEQAKNPVRFRGKKPAEYLETVLYCCPQCKQFGTLKSQDDILSCVCGLKVRYNEFCYFELPDKDEEPPYKTIFDWAKWQKKEIETLAASINSFDSKTPIFTDEAQELIQVEKTFKSTFVAGGRLSLYKDRLSIFTENGETIEFPVETIVDMVGFARMTIIFMTTEHKIFEIHSKHPRSALKYIEMFKALKVKE
jgi:1-acyl-sn-glycerol-3-phosphate acyltransferase